MRDKSFLFKFEEIATLYQYLYLEESHSIEITNILGVILRLRMDERGTYSLSEYQLSRPAGKRLVGNHDNIRCV